jgi:flagellar motor switch protein FliM
MRPEGTFIAERLAAQHCAELLRAPRQAVNPLTELSSFGERLAEVLGGHLGQLCPGAKTQVEHGQPLEYLPNAPLDRRGGPVMNSTVSVGPKDATMIVSLPYGAALSLVDLALGGTGKDCAMPSGKLPMSAQMMFARFETALGSALADVFELASADAVKFKNQNNAPNAYAPYAGCKRVILPLALTIGDAEPCELVFTFPGTSVLAMFAERDKPVAAPRAKSDPLAEPFAAIPLQLRAVLVDMKIPVATLAKLAPGMVIPVTVARSVPLIAGEQIVAHGTVGAMDDCTAIQLTQITDIKEK